MMHVLHVLFCTSRHRTVSRKVTATAKMEGWRAKVEGRRAKVAGRKGKGLRERATVEGRGAKVEVGAKVEGGGAGGAGEMAPQSTDL